MDSPIIQAVLELKRKGKEILDKKRVQAAIEAAIAGSGIQHLDPANTQTPIVGPIRQANKQLASAMGDPLTYTDPNAPVEARVGDAMTRYSDTFMGGHGDIPGASKVAIPALTTKILDDLEGKQSVSPQYIENLTRQKDVKQADALLAQKIVAQMKQQQEAPVANAGLSDMPIRAFHGTSPDFKLRPIKKSGELIFTSNQSYAAGISAGKGSNVIEAELNIKNPYVFDAKGKTASKEYQSILKEKRIDPKYNIYSPYDGMVIKNATKDGDTWYIPFKAEQVNVNPRVANPSLDDVAKKISVPEFSEKMRGELLPINEHLKTSKYENIALPSELRGNVGDYYERIYASPIKTSAGGVHFGGVGEEFVNAPPKPLDSYFAHTRVEDLADEGMRISDGVNTPGATMLKNFADGLPMGKPNGTRRVIEIQSDLFQKGRLENESLAGKLPSEVMADENSIVTNRIKELSKLEPYRNTWHERVIREEVKKAAQDGKTKLQFPVGETAMKIEGLGQQQHNWSRLTEAGGSESLTPDKLKVGEPVMQFGETGADPNQWIITDVLGDGKFKAVPKTSYDRATKTGLTGSKLIDYIQTELDGSLEEFDISGKVDTSNPIYKFYESTVAKYLTKKYGAKRIKDPQGVEWMEVDVDPQAAKKPVEAFAVAPIAGAAALLAKQEKEKGVQVETREKDDFPFPDFQESIPGQTLRADLNFQGKGKADIKFHFKRPDGKVITVPQTKEEFSGGEKVPYGLELTIPVDTPMGEGEVWATVNGKEVPNSRRKHKIIRASSKERYPSYQSQPQKQ